MSQHQRRSQIWAIGTTRNEVDLVRTNMRYHLGQGIDQILLLDNDSTDGTQDVLGELSAEGGLSWSPHRGVFRQDILLTQLAQEALARGADWVIPIDADEFWHAPNGTVREVLEQSSAGALRVQVVNYIQQRYQWHTTPSALLTMTRRIAVPIGPSERAEDLVEAETISYVEHLYHHKWLARTTPALQIGWGNHVLRGALPPVQQTDAIVCLHAPLRSFAVLRAKADAARPPVEVEDYFNMAWHLRRWRRMAWEGSLEKEWRANSYLNDSVDVNGQPHEVLVDDMLCELVRPHCGR